MAEEGIMYSVQGILERRPESNDQPFEPASIRVTFRLYNVQGHHRYIIPETLWIVDEVSIFVPAGDSSSIREVSMLLECRTMSAMGIPETIHSDIVEQIFSKASSRPATGFAISMILVEVQIPRWEEGEFYDYLEFLESPEDQGIFGDEPEGRQIAPAAKSSVDALERLVFPDNLEPPTSCSVCIEEIGTL